jgi:putative FmdB family regulatory protein
VPTYEYECQKCGHRFEAFQSMKDAPLSRCPKCRGKVKRLISGGAGLIFKGSGFYLTDYRSDSYKKRAKEESGGGSSSGGSSGTSGAGESKPSKKKKKGDAGNDA